MLHPLFPAHFVEVFVVPWGLLLDEVLSPVVLVFFLGGSLSVWDVVEFLFPVRGGLGLPFPSTVEGGCWFLRRSYLLERRPLGCLVVGIVKFCVELPWDRKLARDPLPLLLEEGVSWNSSVDPPKSSNPLAAVLLGVNSRLSPVSVGTIVA